MTKQEFREFVEGYPVFLDGATGSNLQRMGMPFGVCAEKWITENEEIFINLQRQYIEAGSQIIYAPTFGANPIKLKEYNLEKEYESLNKRLVEISKKAAEGKALVAGDITMCGRTLEPLGDLPFEDLICCYEQQIKAVEEAGVDLLVVETMMSLQETRAALIAAANVSSLPVMATMTFNEGGKTLYGTDAKTAAIVLTSLGADAVGMNCSAGPDKMVDLVKVFRESTDKPIIAKPNAGMPVLGENNETVYDMNPTDFAEHMKQIAKAGAKIFGGCCGTTPEFIKNIKESLSKEDIAQSEIPEYITSERQFVKASDIVFCKIDTKADNELKEEIAAEDFDTVYDLLDDMEDDEQNTVYICVDGNEDILNTMKKLLPEVLGYTTSPVCFETDSQDTLEHALKNYPGVAAVIVNDRNSGFAEKIATKYGAYTIYP